MDNLPQGSTLQRTKRALLISTIVLLSISALFGIIFVLVDTDKIAWRIIGTTAILGFLSLLSMNNVVRLEATRTPIRLLSITALVSNIVWSLPWIGMVWGIFGFFLCSGGTNCSNEYYAFLDLVYKIIVTASIVSIVTTIVANLLMIEQRSLSIKALRVLSIISITILGIYFLPPLWFHIDSYFELTWRIIAVVAILFVFSCCVLPVLMRAETNKLQKPSTHIDEAAIRREIETEVRAKLAHEQQNTIENQ